MPAVIGRRPPPAPLVRVPSRMAIALQPELDRRVIPARITLDANAPPYAGEIREDQHGTKHDCPPGSFTTLATLRRAWNYVGFAIDPGDALSPFTGLAVTLRVLGSLQGLIANQGLPVAVTDQRTAAYVGFVVGAPCEVVFVNATSGGGAVTIHGVRGSIWGMGEY
jgi:hypothetical protein